MGSPRQCDLDGKTADAVGQLGQNGGPSFAQDQVVARRKDQNVKVMLGSGWFGSITMSFVSYAQDFALDTVRHARLTAQSKSVRDLVEVQAAYLQDRIETSAAYAQEIVELAYDTPLGRRVPGLSVTQTQSSKN